LPDPDIPPAAVLDTNVVLDWLVFADPGVAVLAAAVESGRLRWLACTSMRAELALVVARPQFVPWQADPARVLASFDRHAVCCEPPPPSRLLCTDADDQPFIDLALHGGARWLFSRDRAVLKLARRARQHGLEIAPPSRWPGA
jgi:predicted nucleic acid-binding protein